MPLYDYRCAQCGHVHEQFHGMHEKPEPCMKCGRQACVKIISSAVAIKPPVDSGWEAENGGRGRYIPQMAKSPNDPRAYARSQNDAIEKAKRLGYSVTKSR